MNVMKKLFVIKLVKIVIKYILPVIIGYLEGDTHVIQDNLVSLF